MLDAVDDCELVLRGITGRLFADFVVAMTLFRAATGLLALPPEGAVGAVVFSALSVEGSFMVVGDSDVVFVFLAVGNGGGGIVDSSGTTLVIDVVAPPLDSPSPTRGGEANLAVCRGPGTGALCFFRIGCGGGGLEEDGVGAFILTIASRPSPLIPSGCCVDADPCPSALICSRRTLDL